MLSKRVKCESCIHFSYEKSYPTCDAFPEGIPNEIFSEEVSHTEPYEGDNGILFEKGE